MWYISFHGGSQTSGSSNPVNNIQAYHDSGKPHDNPNLLPTGQSDPTLQELRGFVIVNDELYVVNAYKKYSQLLAYKADKHGNYHFDRILASMQTINSILHPYDVCFDAHGNAYLSSQDTNVVTGIDSSGNALPIAAYLSANYPGQFWLGTQVASSMGELPDTPTPPPPNVALPQGLAVSYTDNTDTRVANSVRGVLHHNGHLYVADEVANAVKVYEDQSFELTGQIVGDNLSAPVQLLLGPKNVLYIGSTGNDSVVSYDISNGAPSGTVAPTTFVDGHVKHVSGMGFDADGHFYAAERKAQKIRKFPADGSGKGEDFITNLPDNPEFILYVPKS